MTLLNRDILPMWYYVLNDERKGPVDKDEIQRLISAGDLAMDDLVWTDGMDDWTPVSEIEDLRPSPPPLPNDASPSSPPTSKDRTTEKPDSKPDIDGSTFSSQENDVFASRNDAARSEEASSTVESAERTGIETTGVTYASFGGRSVAYGIDILITTVVSIALSAFLVYLQPSSDPESLGQGIGLLVAWFYFAGFESSGRQATLGKQLMGLKVTDLSGDKIGFGKASGRHFGKILSGTILLIGFIMAAFTEKKQALHDKMAGCLVMREPEEDSERHSHTERRSQVEVRRPDSINPGEIKAINDGEHCTVCGEKCSNWGNPQIRICESCIEMPGVQERANKFDYD